MCEGVLTETRKGAGFPGVAGCCEQAQHGFWKVNLGPLDEWQGFLTAEPSLLQPHWRFD